MLERHVTSTKTGEGNVQTVYGFTGLSRDEASSDKLLEMTRSYWGIENGLHYRRDVTLNEDRTRTYDKREYGTRYGLYQQSRDRTLLIGKQKHRYLPEAKRFYDAHPNKACDLILLL